MIFRRFFDVYQCSDSLCSKCLLLRFWGGSWRYRCVASILLDMILGWSCALFVMICHMLIHVLIKCSLLRFGGGGGRYRCVAATLLNMIWGWSCTLFVILWMQFDTLAGFLMCLLSFQNSILTWLQRRIAVAFLNVLDVVKAAPQARPKTT